MERRTYHENISWGTRS